ncbi:Hypothetical_protein [Hexamita inflata]|uniref:Hypothetical_protein n=1 Tax=Hexamita inflata TaxID=28002 RepID=A0AA86NSU0_9EUKA|nr:Hypothetical protein HINF_LOCUS11831 [Hexamita inflata]
MRRCVRLGFFSCLLILLLLDWGLFLFLLLSVLWLCIVRRYFFDILRRFSFLTYFSLFLLVFRLDFGIACLLSDLLVVKLLFGLFELTHHCRRCIKLTLQFSLQFGDLLFERLNFLVIAFRVVDYFGLGGFVRFFLCGRILLVQLI